MAVFIATILCLFPLLPIPLLQAHTLHLLLCLPLIVWGFYYLTATWYVDVNRKTLHNTILWFISFLSLLGLSLAHYIWEGQNTSGSHYFWQALAVSISCAMVSLHLLEMLRKRALEHETHLSYLQQQVSPLPIIENSTIEVSELSNEQESIEAEEAFSEQESIKVNELSNEQEGIEIKEITQATVYAGELIPIDGRVVSGEGLVNESALTGNNMLQDKQKGMRVWAGSELELGQLYIESVPHTNPFPSFLAQSLEELRKLKRNLPTEHLLMRYFNNVLIVSTLLWASIMAYGRYQTLSAIEPLLTSFQIWTEVLTLFATILLVACPIALGLAIPLTYRRVLDVLFKKGIRLKNSWIVKKTASLKSMIFSKTGVLTTGLFHIHNFHSTLPSNDFKAILLALEQHSEHPYAKAVLAHFEGDVFPLELSEIRSINGLGIMGKDAAGNTYMAGAYNIAAEFTKEDHHSIYMLVNNRLVGWLDLKDRLREEAEPCVTDLLEKELKVTLLSGDRAIPTQYVARKTGIKDYHFQQLPNQKKAIIEQLQAEGYSAMIVEHSEADDLLSSASVGIELESMPNFNDSAVIADVSIFHHRLLLINELIALCRALVDRIRWIIILAIIYNIFAIILASFGYFSLILAAISSLIVWSITFLLLKI